MKWKKKYIKNHNQIRYKYYHKIPLRLSHDTCNHVLLQEKRDIPIIKLVENTKTSHWLF